MICSIDVNEWVSTVVVVAIYFYEIKKGSRHRLLTIELHRVFAASYFSEGRSLQSYCRRLTEVS